MPEVLPKSSKIPCGALPKDDSDRIGWLRLIRSRRVGPATFIRLLRQNGSVEAGLAALPQIAHQAGVSGYAVCSLAEAENEFQIAMKFGARLLCLGEADYPPWLATIADAPPVLWSVGDVGLAARPNVALVGARNASSLGCRMAKLLAGELGMAGYVVTSGLARGIDTAAHSAALKSGTVAVLAGGVDNIYPAENTTLAAQISESGLILSEMPMGTKAQARHFPRRNRIISGLSEGVVVVEGASRSGSLITAKDALDQGREIMAIPGNPLDARAAGCNMLIRDGAVLVRSGADVIEALGRPRSVEVIEPDFPPVEVTQPKGLAQKVVGLLGPTPVVEDSIIREIGGPTQQVLNVFMELELSGRLFRHPGGMIASC